MATNPKLLYSSAISAYDNLGKNPSEEELRNIAHRMYYACFHYLGRALNIPRYRYGKKDQPLRDQKNKIICDPNTGNPMLEKYQSAHKVLKYALFDDKPSRPLSFNYFMRLMTLRERTEYNLNCDVEYNDIHIAKRLMDKIFANK